MSECKIPYMYASIYVQVTFCGKTYVISRTVQKFFRRYR